MLPEYCKVIGIGAEVEPVIDKIRRTNYTGVSAEMANAYTIPSHDDLLVILLCAGEDSLVGKIAQQFYSAGILTIVIASGVLSETNCWDAITTVPVHSMADIVDAILFPLTEHGRIDFCFSDLDMILRNMNRFKICESSSSLNDGRIKDAISKLSESIGMETRKQMERISLLVYFNRDIVPPITAAEMMYLPDYIDNISDEIDVMWGVYHDDKMPTNLIKVSAIISGKELEL